MDKQAILKAVNFTSDHTYLKIVNDKIRVGSKFVMPDD